MKFSNPDIIRITQIKQYLLDPPYSFKLFQEASGLLAECTGILEKYPAVDASFYDTLAILKAEMEVNKADRSALKNTLQKAAQLIGVLQNR